MHPADVLVQILFAREALSGVAFALRVRADELSLGTTVLVVHFALVANQTATVGEPFELRALFVPTVIRSIMLVRVSTVSRVSLKDHNKSDFKYYLPPITFPGKGQLATHRVTFAYEVSMRIGGSVVTLQCNLASVR